VLQVIVHQHLSSSLANRGSSRGSKALNPILAADTAPEQEHSSKQHVGLLFIRPGVCGRHHCMASAALCSTQCTIHCVGHHSICLGSVHVYRSDHTNRRGSDPDASTRASCQCTVEGHVLEHTGRVIGSYRTAVVTAAVSKGSADCCSS
jgi:hypothetical protein